ncbi:unnamed protein product [Closterium sp. NIES-53]
MVIEGWLEPEHLSLRLRVLPPSPPASAPLAAEPHPPAAAAPHARVPTGPTPVAPVAPVAPVESLVPIVVVDAPPGALILDAPLVSVALRAPVAAVGSSPHAVSATTGGPGPGEPHPPAAAAPHARVPTGPTPVAPVAPVAPVESLVPIVVVDAPPGALILDAPLVSVALRAPVAAVGSSPHAVSATTGGRGRGVGGGGALRYRLPSYRLRRHRCCPRTSRWFLILRRSQLLPWLSVRHLRAAGSIGRTLLRPGTSERRRGGDTILLGAKGPRRTGLHPVAVAVAGGGGRGRGGGWAYDRPVTMADLQRFVSDAMRLERNGQAS